MNRAVRTGVPPLVTSVTSTTPRPIVISTRAARPGGYDLVAQRFTGRARIHDDLDPVALHDSTMPYIGDNAHTKSGSL